MAFTTRVFQDFVTSNYVGPAGLFGITPGAIPPRWTPEQLTRELMGEYATQPLNFQGTWLESTTQCIGIILQTVVQYTILLGTLAHKKLNNTQPEWDEWQKSVNA